MKHKSETPEALESMRRQVENMRGGKQMLSVRLDGDGSNTSAEITQRWATKHKIEIITSRHFEHNADRSW